MTQKSGIIRNICKLYGKMLHTSISRVLHTWIELMMLLPYNLKDISSCSICRYHKFISKGELGGLYFLFDSLFLLYGLMRSCCAVLLVWLDLSVQKKINLDEE